MKGVLIFFLAWMLLCSACLKRADLSKLSSNLVVATNSDPEANFSSYKTYYISDSVAYLSDVNDDSILINANTQQLVNSVKQHMADRGFTFVDRSANPDLGINMGIVKIVDVGVIYPGWWEGYPGWWDPWYWGWYYPYYYPWSVSYVVETGSIVLDLVDIKNATDNKALKVVWGAVMGGALGQDADANLQCGLKAIDQAFIQTPALKTN